ncbi:putative MFS transporter [Cutaneotrichosporon oleaginosum]|uniref:Putative MFS transporter n=1 Tax=Cutaneotrichosporon oleaginosum TaxID=879819 RepID=A0A0J0XI52_9TREE|nr:putative MFS transporter [Cutaneotrichosporon oleaginosum]KLT40781.1 putative MFS transporter [Cutaneotrichosporon oleaginosum]TXT11907.1 hypothetical protein COLE_02317 [Cutaneotrichosporon oleaginosum]
MTRAPHTPDSEKERSLSLEGQVDDLAGKPRWYRFGVNSWSQITLVSIICFFLPGMYNAIAGLGGSGQLDPTIGANASVALLSVGAATGLLVGQPMFDIFGVRCIIIGGWTYALYTGSLLNYNHRGNGAFVIGAGAVLGWGATCLWVTQGAIMLSYPLPHQKGRSIAWFWMIFNLGGAIGSFISLGINYNRIKAGTVSDSTYVAFMVLMLFGWGLCFFLVPPHLVRRTDGSRAAPPKVASEGKWYDNFTQKAKDEIIHIIQLKDEPRILFLIPMCFAANWFYSYQQNIVNGGSFTLRARSLNSALYWAAQMFGGMAIGLILDMPWFSRPKRALCGWAFVFVTGNVIMGGGLAYQKWFDAQGKKNFIDFSDSKLYVGPCWLYIWYGALDAFWQGFAYWMLGALCNTPKEAARFVGVYKSMQCVGGAVAFRLTANHLSSMKQFISNWAIVAGALIFALPAVLRVTEPTETEAKGLFVSEEDDRPGAQNKKAAEARRVSSVA